MSEYELSPEDASQIVSLLDRVAGLSLERAGLGLTDDQRQFLTTSAIGRDPAQLARRLRELAFVVREQLPPGAPDPLA
jgi:hypothetical protein